MANMKSSVGIFFKQLRGLLHKNFIHLVYRKWLSSSIQCLILPIVLIAVFLNIENFARVYNGYGVGTPAPIPTFEESLRGGRDLVILANATRGPDIKAVIERFRAPMARYNNKLVVKERYEEIAEHCQSSNYGVSKCHAAILLDDSPLSLSSTNRTGNWVYSILSDSASRYPASFDVQTHDSFEQKVILPLQVAINSFITNRTSPTVEVYEFTDSTQEEQDIAFQKSKAENLRGIFALIYFLTQLFGVYKVVSFVTTERNQGLSQLVDVMGGGTAAVRVLSTIIAFNILYLPFSIASGILYQQFAFRQSNAALLIFWSILTTMAIINSATFAASFFQGPRVSSIVVVAACIGIAVASLIVDNDIFSKEATIISLAFFFPSANYIHTLCLMGRSAKDLAAIDAGKVWKDIYKIKLPSGRAGPSSQVVGISIWMYLVFVVLQILLYPLAAILVERLLHGVSFRRRGFAQGAEAEASSAAIQATGLRKEYPPSLMRRIFCCAKRSSTVKAVDGLDLVAQKRQVLCLLGVNGSGKSTTLDMIAGIHHSTAGNITINAEPTQLGVCPQKNVLFPYLTVLEHVRIWSLVKNGNEDLEALTALVVHCGLEKKINSQSRELSGGQKRKLQLACMLVGGSQVVLLDEMTSGLDPLSRQSIWNIVLGERAKRSIVLTTHYLEEAEVLSDHVVLLSKGKVLCQGSGAELKNKFGGGYTVHIPKTDAPLDLGVPTTTHQDRTCYQVATTSEAAALIGRLEAAGQPGIAMSGPTIEGVFLRLNKEADETLRLELDGAAPVGQSPATHSPLTPGKPISSWAQILVLMRKRMTILPRYWVAPFLALALSVAIPPAGRELLVFREGLVEKLYQRPSCRAEDAGQTTGTFGLYESRPWVSNVGFEPSYAGMIPIGPPSINASLYRTLAGSAALSPFLNLTRNPPKFRYVDSLEAFQDVVRNNVRGVQQGLYVKDSNSIVIARLTRLFSGSNNAMGLIGLWTAMENPSANISTSSGIIPRRRGYYDTSGSNGWASIGYIMLITGILAIYPCFFTLYPAYERSHSVRALQYTNGVRPFPLWMSHLLVDSSIILMISIALTATITAQLGSIWYEPGYVFIVALLYGLAAVLLGYLVSARLARTQLSSFLWTFLISIIEYFGAFMAFYIAPVNVEPQNVTGVLDAISWGMGVVFPIANVQKALMVGLNTYRINCRPDGHIPYGGSIFGYGGPILLLVIQVICFALLLVWLESNNSFAAMTNFLRQAARQKKLPVTGKEEEEVGLPIAEEVSKEAARVDVTTSDLLRISHVSKAFGDNQAVDDMTFGLGEGEILALLGPNGAGKTTLITMITGELRPDAGEIFLRGVDVQKHTRLAQKSLGLCPQWDALDLMTARQHLEFYARIRGVEDVAQNVGVVLEMTGLKQHADKPANKLSGGNKRKLSLGISLVGNPDILCLDEPSTSMDALSRRLFWRTLSASSRGKSVLLVTHSMEEADALATRAAIVSKRLLAIGTTQQLRDRYSNLYHVQLVLKTSPESSREEMEVVERWVRSQFGGVVFEGESLGGQVKFTVPNKEAGRNSSSSTATASASEDTTEAKLGGGDGDKTIGEIIMALENHKEKLGLHDYSIGAPTLEKVFGSVVRNNYVEEDGRRRRWWKLWRY